jgi:hypothetical protein
MLSCTVCADALMAVNSNVVKTGRLMFSVLQTAIAGLSAHIPDLKQVLRCLSRTSHVG